MDRIAIDPEVTLGAAGQGRGRSVVSQPLAPFVPKILFSWPHHAGHPQHRRVTGTLAFADISGFTALTERLAGRGRAGAEEMSDLLDAVFAELLTVAAEYDAHLVKWGGDALLLLFQGEQHEAAAARACHEMMRTLDDAGRLQTSVGEVTLRMSAGVHSGEVDFVLAGTRHRELVITGPTATTTARMEAMAEAGEILLSATTATALPEVCRGERRGDGVLLAEPPEAHRRPPQEDHDPGDQDLTPFLPEAIRNFLLAHGGEGEHREVAVAFVEFRGTDALLESAGPTALTAALHHLLTVTQEAAARHRVSFWESDIGVDGGKLMLVAGAPRSVGDNHERLLHVARAVVDSPGPLSVRIGVNAGRVFAGGFGPDFRRTYSVKGDAVNLAARVMGKADDGEVWATEAVVRRCADQFATEPVEPFMVKGKTGPVHAHRVGPAISRDWEATATRHTPLLGRDEDLGLLLEGVSGAEQGTGAVVVLVGEPGIGKSRLVAELIERSGLARVALACEEYESATPYAAARRLLRRLLGVADDADRATAAEVLTDRLRRDAPQLAGELPLLAAVADADVPATAEISQLDEQFRRHRLEQATGTLLERLLPRPGMLIVDDAHLCDDSSAAVLAALCARAPTQPLLLVVTRRDQPGGLVVPEDAYPVEVRLEPLAQEAAEQLADAVTEDDPLPEHVLEALIDRAGGNPLFLRSLVEAARAGDSAASLPDSVEGVIGARIDRLPPADRSLLRAAAALGQRFDPVLLTAVLTRESRTPPLGAWRRLAAFVHPDGEDMVFNHALVRDTAYEGLSYKRRLTLHGLIGEALEHRAGGVSETHAELLALHYAKAERWQPTWFYARIAGDRAVTRYALVEAAEFYLVAVAAGRRQGVEPQELAAVMEKLADVRTSLGEFAVAAGNYREAWDLSEASPVDRARLAARLAAVSEYVRDLDEALDWVTRGEMALHGHTGNAVEREQARLVARRAFLLHQQGDDSAAQSCALAAVEQAQRCGARDALAMGYTVLDIIDQMRGRLGVPAEEVPAHRALEIWRELADLPWQARLLNYLGARAYFEGRWSEAVSHYEESRATYLRIGDAFNAAMELGNIAEIVGDRGDPGRAVELLRQVVRRAKASGASFEVLFFECLRARFLARAGDPAAALRELERITGELDAQGRAVFALDARARQAECLALLGRARDALAMAEAQLDRAANLPGTATALPLLHRVRGFALAQSGRSSEAAEALRTSLDLAREQHALHEVAFTLDALVRLAEMRPDLDMAGAAGELATLREQLAMTAFPPIAITDLQNLVPQQQDKELDTDRSTVDT